MKRDRWVMAGIVLVAVVIGTATFKSDSTSDTSSLAGSQQSAVIVPFTRITQGKQSAIARRVNYLITSTAQLDEIWKMIHATGTPPKVDFNKEAVVAVFAGEETSPYITVVKIEDTNTRMVSITLAKLDGACANKQLTASPYEIVVMPTTSLPLAHKDIITTAGCSE